MCGPPPKTTAPEISQSHANTHSAPSTSSKLSLKCFYQFVTPVASTLGKEISPATLWNSPVSPELRLVVCPITSFLQTIWVEVKVAQSCLTLCDPTDSPGSSLARIQEWVAIPFSSGSSQGSNPGLPHHRQILYQLSHKGSPRILEWVAYPFCSGSSWPRNRTRVSCIAGGNNLRTVSNFPFVSSFLIIGMGVMTCNFFTHWSYQRKSLYIFP